MVKVFDNFLQDAEVIEKLWDYFLFKTPQRFKERSSGICKKSTTQFYSTEFTLEDEFIKILYFRIFDFLKLDRSQYNPYRIHTNIQHFGMGLDSDFHKDGTEITAVYFLSPNVEGGQFIYLDNEIEKIIDYKQDRLLVFDGELMHKALPPSNLTARISLAFKVDKLC